MNMKNAVNRENSTALTQGYTQIYTGDGKGKTTAAIGLCIRGAGAGLKVFFGQFMKPEASSELNIFRQLELITSRHYGRKGFIIDKPAPEDYTDAKEGYHEIISTLKNSTYDIVVADEIINTLTFDLLTTDNIENLIDIKKPETELILTGRNAPDVLKNKADLVTEMKALKHYYKQGVRARQGIEY